MWGALQIGFYLTRDTLHRWFTRISSPLSRLTVVYFLSLCGLIFLSSYVVSIKILRGRIHSSGADLVVASEFIRNGITEHPAGRSIIPPSPADYLLFIFNEAFISATLGRQHYTVVEYAPGCTQLFPENKKYGVFLLPATPTQQSLPEMLQLENFSLTATSIPEHKAGILRRIYQTGALFIPHGSLSGLWQNGFMRKYVMRMQNPTAKNVQEHENMLQQLARLDKRNLHTVSSGKLLQELGQLERSQYSFRVWVTIGISLIICLLLTSISSLEFRQSSHVYALIGSFGISRAVLYLSFLAENTVLVAAGFGVSLCTVWGIRDYITQVLYKSPDIRLNLWELENDIRTFLLAFGICIIVSSIPIAVAACRPIGKVLK